MGYRLKLPSLFPVLSTGVFAQAELECLVTNAEINDCCFFTGHTAMKIRLLRKEISFQLRSLLSAYIRGSIVSPIKV
jgi:hypothetical protein